MKINYWSDYMCPFCYIGEKNLMKSLDNTGLRDKVVLEMHSFQLDTTMPKVSDDDVERRMARKYKMPHEKVQQRIKAIDRAGKEAGIDMRYQNVRLANTFDAHRLTKYAQKLAEPTVAEKLEELIFNAVFTQGLVISDHEVLAKLAAEAGLTDAKAVKAVLDSDEFGLDVKSDEHEAQRMGIRSVPYFLIGETVLPGAYDVEDMEEVLKHVYAKEKAQAPEPEHQGCTAEGCAILR